MQKMNYVVTKENFEGILKTFCVGANNADSYNSNCFSTYEVLRSRAINEMIGYMIESLEGKGYSASEIMNPIMKPHNRWVVGDSPSGLKEQIDNEFKLGFEQYRQAWDYCHAVSV